MHELHEWDNDKRGGVKNFYKFVNLIYGWSSSLSFSLPLLARDSITEEAKIGTMGRPRTSKICWEQRDDVKKNSTLSIVYKRRPIRDTSSVSRYVKRFLLRDYPEFVW